MPDDVEKKTPTNSTVSIKFLRRTWFQATVTDDLGQGLGGWSYELELANGDLRDGELGGDGKVRVEDALPGVCTLRLKSPKGDAKVGEPEPFEPPPPSGRTEGDDEPEPSSFRFSA